MLRHCLEPGCYVLVQPGVPRCPTHASQHARRRGTRQEQGYGADWQRVRLEVLERDDYTCHYCGTVADSVDHVLPKVRGGSDDEANLVAACIRCNSAKRDRGVARR